MALYTTISVSPSSREINGSNAFTISIAFSSTASQLKETRIEVAGQTYSIGTVTASSFTWTPPTALLNAMSTLTSATVIISGQPANSSGFSLVDRISCYCTVTVPASYVPSKPTGVSLTRVDNGVPAGWGLYVQNKSKMNVSWAAASGTGGSTIKEYRVYTDTNSGYYTATGTSITGLGPFAAGTRTVTVVAVDSRGRTATSTGVTYEVQPYSVPGVSKQKVDRTTNAGVVDNLGTYLKANVTYTFASVGGKNSASATFAYKTTAASSYSAETAIAQSTDKIFGGSFSSLTAYHVRFTVTDALGSVTTYVATVESLKIALEFESNSNRLWVHCPLTMNADATFNNLITSGGNSHLMLNGQSYISLRTGGTERGYFHSGGLVINSGTLSVNGTVSCTNLSVTNPPWPTIPTNPTFDTVTCNMVTSGSGSHLYLRGASYLSFQTGTTERGYFHSGGLNINSGTLYVNGKVECTNLSVTNPPWPTSVSLPSSPSFSGICYANSFYAYSDSPGYAINSYSMVNIVSSMSRFNYGLRSVYDAAVHGASRVSFRIGDGESMDTFRAAVNKALGGKEPAPAPAKKPTMTAAQQGFIDRVGKAARDGSDILPSLTIAQAILESGWGKSELAQKANALFGIKAGTSWKGQRMDKKTAEHIDGEQVEITAAFRAYASWEESIADHGAFLRGSRYKAVQGERDYKKACRAVHTAGYATDPGYANSLIKLVEQYGLTAWDAGEITHVVKQGDTLWALAVKHLGSGHRWPEIQALNGGSEKCDPYKLRIGSTLKIPTGGQTK